MATRFIDSVIVYRILRMLITPFKDTQAFKLGIVDDKGRELKRMSQLHTVAERDAYTLLHRLVFRLKRIIEKVPAENKKLLSFAAALALVKEHVNSNHEPIDLEVKYFNKMNEDLSKEVSEIESLFENRITFKMFLEDAPANNASATPGIAGFTPETLGIKTKPKLLRRKKIIQ